MVPLAHPPDGLFLYLHFMILLSELVFVFSLALYVWHLFLSPVIVQLTKQLADLQEHEPI